MFSKNRKGFEPSESVVSAAKTPGNPLAPPKGAVDPKAVPSIFGADATLEGNLSTDGELQFDGKIKGNIRASKLTVGKDAHVFGEVSANTVVVRGRLKGLIRGKRVEIVSTGHVEGEVFHTELAVEAGAYFMGNCQRMEDPFATGGKTPSSENASRTPADSAGGSDQTVARTSDGGLETASVKALRG